MTRLKLIPWLAIPALLLLFGPVIPIATAAPPLASEEDGLIYLPLDEEPGMQEATHGSLKTSMTGVVPITQYGVADALVGNSNGFLAVRFDPPFDAPYTLTSLSFRTATALQIAGKLATFISVRIVGMNATTGLPDESQQHLRLALYKGSNNGGMSTIPLSIAGAPGQTFFALFHFPRPPAAADTFPFLFTDRNFMDRGLYANSFATDTQAVVRTAPPIVGTVMGTALLIDQNLNVALTCTLTDQAPMNPPGNHGLNLRDEQANWSYSNPANILADGDPAPNSHLLGVELLSRGITWSAPYATGGAGAEKVTLPAVPGSGMQIWGVRSLDKSGNYSLMSNVTVTGPATVIGYPSAVATNQEDADEANGLDNESEAAPITVPVSNRPESIWPGGDQDNYWFYAQPGQQISVSAMPTHVDNRNDMKLVVNLIDNSGDVVESDVASAGGTASLSYDVAPPSGNSSSKAFKRFIVQVMDKSGSPEDPANWHRVLISSRYKLSVDAVTLTAALLNEGNELSETSPSATDDFAFANAGSNPVRGHATFSYVIPRSRGEESVKLRIYDVKGRHVSTLVSGARTAGTHFASWSGHDVRGNRAPAGPYFARFQAGSFSRTVRIIVN